MIAISRGIGPLGLPVVPAGTPPAVPAAGGAAPGAFDTAFAELTSALLATAAGAAGAAAASKAAPVTGGDAPVDGAGHDTDTSAMAAATVPVVVPVPAPLALPMPTAGVDGAPGESVADDAIGDATLGTGATDAPATVTATATAAATANAAGTAAAHALASSSPAIGGAPPAGGAAISSEILGGEDIREGWVDETFSRETRGDDSGDADAVHTPSDPILPAGLRRRPAPVPSQPLAATGEAPSAPPVAAKAAASAPSPTSTTAAAEGHAATTPAVEATPTEGTPTAGPTESATPPIDAATPPVTSGLARRAEALQRALGRRAEAEHGDSAPAGPTTQAARAEAAVAAAGAAQTPTNGQGANEGGESASHQRRAVRMAAAGAPIAAAQVTPGTAQRPEHADPSTGASAPNWRAAAMAARFAEPAAASGETPRQGAAPAAAVSFAAAVAAAGMPALREARPAVVEAPVHLPAEAATAEHVQMQIVKSMRLQWTGATQEARVQLKPEYLGEVVANIKVEQGVVTATLHADTPEVRRMLETQTASLREALVEHGLKLDKVVIAEPETPSGQQGDRRSRGRQPQPESSRPKPRRARDDGDGATFELRTE